MSNSEKISINVSLPKWVEAVKEDETAYKDRQVVEILLNAIGLSNDLKKSLYLKGGTLMALAFRSERLTADVDFSCIINDHNKFAEDLASELNPLLIKAANTLGYLNIICRVQKIKKMPRSRDFEEASFPALKATVGYAIKGSSQEMRLIKGTASRTIELDISFNEQISAFQELILDTPLISIRAYSPTELLAEKFRAIIQQKVRNRTRRQDVFDINYLLGIYTYSPEDKKEILETFLMKAHSRNLVVNPQSLNDAEIRKRSQSEWNSLQEEISGPLPDFNQAYRKVQNFYQSLPW